MSDISDFKMQRRSHASTGNDPVLLALGGRYGTGANYANRKRKVRGKYGRSFICFKSAGFKVYRGG